MSRRRIVPAVLLAAVIALPAVAGARRIGREVIVIPPPVYASPYVPPAYPYPWATYPGPYGYAPPVYGYPGGYAGWVPYDPYYGRLVPGFEHPGWRGSGYDDYAPQIRGFSLH